MKIEELLRDDERAILDEAVSTTTLLSHYRRDGEEATRRRVRALYRAVARAVSARDLDELVAHAGRIALERFQGGFEQAEVEAAFATLEEAIEHRALAQMPREELAWGLGLVATALGVFLIPGNFSFVEHLGRKKKQPGAEVSRPSATTPEGAH